LNELVDVIIEEKAALFVCAIGVPPKPVVEKLHKAGIPVMNVRVLPICRIFRNPDDDPDGWPP
jgi:NAD(P)H-dependent flavin oxidoreductase YrpB (nitropropane dioxygenase family)